MYGIVWLTPSVELDGSFTEKRSRLTTEPVEVDVDVDRGASVVVVGASMVVVGGGVSTTTTPVKVVASSFPSPREAVAKVFGRSESFSVRSSGGQPGRLHIGWMDAAVLARRPAATKDLVRVNMVR